jgi:hypothetical protein
MTISLSSSGFLRIGAPREGDGRLGINIAEELIGFLSSIPTGNGFERHDGCTKPFWI